MVTIDPLLLDAVVVVGYGETRRRNLAGSVASLRPAGRHRAPASPGDRINNYTKSRVSPGRGQFRRARPNLLAKSEFGYLAGWNRLL